MSYKLVLLLACAALVAGARVSRREAADASSLDLQKTAETIQKEIAASVNKIANSPTSKEFTKSLQESTNTLLDQLTTLGNSLGEALKDASGKAKETLESSRASIEKAASDLRKEHPEVERQAAAIGERFNQAVGKGVEVTQNVAKELQAQAEHANKELTPKVKSAVEKFTQDLQELQKKLVDAGKQ